ncbi:MAG: hypothetical protein WCB74_22240, partial [Pseudolabrys sp.]
MISSELAAGQSDLRYSYLVFNPGKKNHRHAEQVHGFSDLSLRFQDPSHQSGVDIGTPAHAHPA